jgi:hypothetical protein
MWRCRPRRLAAAVAVAARWLPVGSKPVAMRQKRSQGIRTKPVCCITRVELSVAQQQSTPRCQILVCIAALADWRCWWSTWSRLGTLWLQRRLAGGRSSSAVAAAATAAASGPDASTLPVLLCRFRAYELRTSSAPQPASSRHGSDTLWLRCRHGTSSAGKAASVASAHQPDVVAALLRRTWNACQVHSSACAQNIHAARCGPSSCHLQR